MKKLLVIVVLGLLWCSVGIAEKYPKIKDPVKSISGSIKKLKIPGKVNLKDYNVKNPGSKIYIDVVKRRLELKGYKNNHRLCKPSKSYELFPSMPEIGGHKWKQEGASPIDFINFAEPMIEIINKHTRGWLATGDAFYLDKMKEQILLWSKENSFNVLISDGYNKEWDSDFAYIDTLENVRQTLVGMLIAFDVLRQEKALTVEEDKIIYEWFEKTVAKTSIGTNDGSKDKMTPGNHTEASKARIYTLWSILSGDEKYFQAGLKFYGIALNVTRKDGSSSHEIRKQKGKSNRSKRGLLKMTQVVGGMVMIAEVFANQGYDLYSFETKKGVTVHKMIDFLITYLGYPDSGAKKKAYIDPEIMETKRILKKTGINDNTLGWAHAYVKRFPNKETTKKLIKYYLEPYGWSRYIQNSGGFGIHMSCAYANINKIK
jgi:hypothetical protein|tara:strand:- start:9 stop:1298 length:1290 start_codon:yes stop_codon:yes gene_type:complete